MPNGTETKKHDIIAMPLFDAQYTEDNFNR